MKKLYSLLAVFLLLFTIVSCSDDGGGGTTGDSGTTGYAYIVNGQFQPQVGDPYYSYYSSAAGLSGSALRTALKTIISAGHTDNTYTSLWTSFQTTDSIPSGTNTGKVWDMYSDTGTGEGGPYYFTFVTDQDSGSGGGSEGEYYNREHSWPNSWFGGSSVYPQYADLMHLYPTDKYVNNQRGNYAYGFVGTASATYQNGGKLGSPSTQLVSWGCGEATVFEPINAFKGDLARTYFYMCTRYFEVGTDTSPMTTGSYKLRTWAQNALKAWHELDPVSSKETARNTAVQGIQHNRNPYIDYPGLVTIIDFTQ